MSIARSFPETFNSEESDLRNDPTFLRYAAELDAAEDFEHAIPLIEGLLSRRQSGNCTTAAEVDAYRNRYQRLALQKIASDSGIANIVCEPFCPW